jgi:hypothetical protein
MDEHRIAPRHRVLKAGMIEFGGGAIDCRISDFRFWHFADVLSILIDVCYWGGRT